MASVLFSTVGQAIGGPLGAAVGAVVGGGADSILFGQRRAAALEPYVQRSAYGDVVPRVYGRTRVAGRLIWAQVDAMEGKGSGRRKAGASIAIALSAGPVLAVGRIWADGREIRNAAGNFETPTVMRVHKGHAGQEPDPLILSAEGEGSAPAYRGLAYVVFENLDLAPFGNRVPNLSFEVTAAGAAPADWLGDVVGGAGIGIDAGGVDAVATGYAAISGAAGEAGVLAAIAGLSLSYADGRARYVDRGRHAVVASADLLDVTQSGAEIRQGRRPAGIALTYLDEARDYLHGRQQIARGRTGERLEAETPLCATAGAALTLAGRLLREAEARVETIEFGLTWKWLWLTVGDLVTIDGRGPWCIRERDIRGLAVHCRAERVADPAVRPASIGDPGRGNGAPMVPAGPTDIRLIEAPVPLTGEQPALFVWLGGGAGWRGAAAYLLEAGNETPLGEVRDASARGQLVAPLTAGQDLFWDREGALLVAVEAGLPGFETRTEQDVLAGANLLLVGEELLQFRDAWMVGDGIVRLSCLLRGRFGTGAHAGWHEPGKTVRQVVPERLLRLAISADDVGRERVILAVGRGDPAGGTEASGTITGVALGPMAPVHLRVVRRADGAIEGDWMARAAAMWPWSYPEGRALLWRWKFAETAGQTVGGTLTAASLRLSVAEQVALRGAPFGPGLLMVEVAGEGPAASRTAQAYLN